LETYRLIFCGLKGRGEVQSWVMNIKSTGKRVCSYREDEG